MNIFDYTITDFVLNTFSGSWFFDEFTKQFVYNELLKGGVIATLIWWMWFKPHEKLNERRAGLILAIMGSFVAVFIARVLAKTLPFRIRPYYDPTFTFTSSKFWLEKFSSFPSDHATLFFALSFGIYLASKRAGYFALTYTLLFICMPRIYLGYHYPTDILAGMLIGVMTIFAISKITYFKQLSIKANQLGQKHQEFFYPLLFLITFQICDLYRQVRMIAMYFIEDAAALLKLIF